MTPVVTRHPVRTLVLVAAVFGLCGGALLHFGITQDGGTDVFVVRGDLTWRRYQRFLDEFGSQELLVVAVGGEGIFSPKGLEVAAAVDARARDLGRRLVVDGTTDRDVVEDVLGLHAVPRARDLWAQGRGLEAAALPLVGDSFSHRPGEEEGLVFVVLQLAPDLSPQEGEALVAGLPDLLALPKEAGFEAAAVGGPVLDVALSEASRHQGDRLFPFLGAGSVLALLVLLRSVVATLLVLATTIVTLPVTLLCIVVTGHELNLLTSGLPVVLLVLGTTVSLHVLRACRTQDPSIDAAQGAARALRSVRGPCLTASLTTALGFLALTLSEVAPVREMGLFAAIGVIVAFFVAVNVIPSAAALGWVRRTGTALASEGGFPVGPPRVVLGATVIAVAVSLAGILRLDVESSAIDFLSDEHPVSQGYRFLQDRGVGLSSLEVLIRTPRIEYFASPDVVARLSRMEREVRTLPGVTEVVSLADALDLLAVELDATMSPQERTRLRDELARKVGPPPPDAGPGASLAPLVALDLGRKALPADFPDLTPKEQRDLGDLIRSWVREDATKEGVARLHISGESVDAQAVASLAERLAPLARRFEGSVTGARVEVTGSALVALRVQQSLISSQAQSLTVAVLLVGAAMLFALGSVRLALIASVPNLFPLVLLYGGMGWLGIRLDAATVMVGAIALGISVDDTVHVLSHYDPKRPPAVAVRRALREVWWPVVTTSVVAICGFSVLGFSTFLPMMKFGLMVAGAMGLALIGDLLILPAVILLFGPRPALAELMHFTGRGSFGTWPYRARRSWFRRLRSAWRSLESGAHKEALTQLDGFLADTRGMAEGKRVRRARGAAEYWRLRALLGLLQETDDPVRRRAYQAALETHREQFPSRYPELEDLNARVREIGPRSRETTEPHRGG
jgi:predicted RND superfamily exporter protein